MNVHLYDQTLWKDDRTQFYSHNLDVLLKLRNTLLVLRNGQSPFQVVLGVPHHAIIGQSRIAENWTNPTGNKGRSSDENVSSYALVTYSRLCDRGIDCKLVIACHFTDHDPNKDIESPYCREVFAQPLKLLVECHGAGTNRKNDIEISSGSNTLIKALDFGRELAREIKYQYPVAAQVCGKSRRAKTISNNREIDSKLSLPALKTTSLIYAEEMRMPALHIEAKAKFRISKYRGKSVTNAGIKLGLGLANVLSSRL
jgi:hypothetical protein